MKICRYIGFSFVLAMFLLTSCFDDKGNYDYKEIGEAVIKAIPGVTDHGDKLVCLENEHIQLTPELEFKEVRRLRITNLFGTVIPSSRKERTSIMNKGIRWR